MQGGLSAYEPSSQTGVIHFLVDLVWKLFVVFAVVYLAAVGYGIARGERNAVLGARLAVPARLSLVDVQEPPEVAVNEQPHVSVDVSDPTREQLLLWTAKTMSDGVLVAFVLWFLRGLTRSAKEGDPFAGENVRRLRGIGFALAFGAPIVAILDSWADGRLLDTLPASTTAHLSPTAFSPPFDLILVGMGAFILAAVFAYGVRLREDVEATV